jgi:RES domain-containing protein
MPSALLREKFREALPLTQPFHGICTRIPDTARFREGHALSSEGSRIWGGRYNPKGAFGALYLSCARDTCLAEVAYYFKRSGNSLNDLPPEKITGLKTELTVEVQLSHVLDLTDPAIQELLGIHEDQLKAEWDELQAAGEEVFTQLIGSLAREAGWEALRVPSARHTGHNLVILNVESLSDDSYVQVKTQKAFDLNELAPFM